MKPPVEQTFVTGGEGFSIHTSESNGKFFVTIDESTLVSMLSQEDAAGIEPIRTVEFSSEAERQRYLESLLKRSGRRP